MRNLAVVKNLRYPVASITSYVLHGSVYDADDIKACKASAAGETVELKKCVVDPLRPPQPAKLHAVR